MLIVVYQVGVDWAGILLERATGLKLGDYMQKNIFEPLGITEISFAPSEQMKSRLAYMNQRAVDGTLSGRDHLLNRSLNVQSEEDARSLFHSGGAGLFAGPREFTSKIITFHTICLPF